MSSISTSNEILSIRGLNLVFKLRLYDQRSVRDLFVKLAKNPLESLLRKSDSLHVLKDIDLTVRRGDRIALIGVNGSGKTSLCRCIAQLLQPASGTVKVFGSWRAIFNSYVGVLPQLTGRENARLLGRLYYPDEPETSLLVLLEEALDFSELGHFLDAPYETYSHGMKSRLHLSIATAKSCDLLILDEVYDNADIFFQKKMGVRTEKFIKDSGAVIFVSHSPDYIRKFCNRGVVLQNSKIRFDGGVDKALSAYLLLNGASENHEQLHQL